MNCPVCKYANPQGATHCGMCYEVFNRSAAQTYLHAVKRENRRESGEVDAAPVVKETKKVVAETFTAVEKIDWRAVWASLASFIKRSRVFLLLIAGIVAAWMLVGFLTSPSLWYHLFGKKLIYAYSTRAPNQYLVGFTQGIKTWSELSGRLDTPMEEYKVEELGNVLFEKKKSGGQKRQTVALRIKEWIQSAARRAWHLEPHPSFKSSLARRRQPWCWIKMGRSWNGIRSHRRAWPRDLFFLAPKLPAGRLRRGQTWTEPVEWVDVYNDWKIYWTGTLLWTLGDLEPCSEGTCMNLTSQADFVRGSGPRRPGPRTRSRPFRPKSRRRARRFLTSNTNVLCPNHFSYEGLLRIPITNLGRIPRALRIGRRVKDAREIS